MITEARPYEILQSNKYSDLYYSRYKLPPRVASAEAKNRRSSLKHTKKSDESFRQSMESWHSSLRETRSSSKSSSDSGLNPYSSGVLVEDGKERPSKSTRRGEWRNVPQSRHNVVSVFTLPPNAHPMTSRNIESQNSRAPSSAGLRQHDPKVPRPTPPQETHGGFSLPLPAAEARGESDIGSVLGSSHGSLDTTDEPMAAPTRWVHNDPSAPISAEVNGDVIPLSPRGEFKKIQSILNTINPSELFRHRQFPCAEPVLDEHASQSTPVPIPFMYSPPFQSVTPPPGRAPLWATASAAGVPDLKASLHQLLADTENAVQQLSNTFRLHPLTLDLQPFSSESYESHTGRNDIHESEVDEDAHTEHAKSCNVSATFTEPNVCCKLEEEMIFKDISHAITSPCKAVQTIQYNEVGKFALDEAEIQREFALKLYSGEADSANSLSNNTIAAPESIARSTTNKSSKDERKPLFYINCNQMTLNTFVSKDGAAETAFSPRSNPRQSFGPMPTSPKDESKSRRRPQGVPVTSPNFPCEIFYNRHTSPATSPVVRQAAVPIRQSPPERHAITPILKNASPLITDHSPTNYWKSLSDEGRRGEISSKDSHCPYSMSCTSMSLNTNLNLSDIYRDDGRGFGLQTGFDTPSKQTSSSSNIFNSPSTASALLREGISTLLSNLKKDVQLQVERSTPQKSPPGATA